ncbi:MAG: bifunctional phosphopantothenoylcysteine decarboxylase/phosphopantothenate--cysteine ligase CoaBC [Deltaproteobacteria bacterium]|nr:bifunctional phosphopantothenoylcysteine decarboxylase/phosphopantothenate--cysteine ligase CoaBC [Deltaproteobacteria bacterium]
MSERPLAGRTVALCVAGGIAAYKAVVVARLLVQAGARVLPLMTASGARFVGKITLSGVCGEGVVDDMWDPKFAGEAHVAIADRADAVAIVPCTADLLARLAQGRADDLVAALALVARTPLILAPAMHPRMWAHPATRRNVAIVAADGRATLVGPVHGEVANGDVGFGRMSEPEAIFAAIVEAIGAIGVQAIGVEAIGRGADLAGKHVVVSAGPTVEDLDPVRFLGNRSTGKMGFAVAAAAAARGARVTLVTGPVSLPTPAGVERVDVRGALEMGAALDRALGDQLADADALVMAAAVSDWRPRERSPHKTKKGAEGTLTLELVKNPDLLAGVGARRGERARPVLVGFAVETDDLLGYARRKRAEKKVDLVVGNLAAHGFGGDDDEVVIVGDGTERPLRASKRAIADAILDEIAARLA